MAVTEVTEKVDGASASVDKYFVKTYVRVFQVVCSDNFTRAGTAISAVGIGIGDHYKILAPDGITVLEEDTTSFCQDISCTVASQADDGCQWDVTLKYGPFGGEAQVFPENPLDHPLVLSWGSARFEETAEADRDGNAILNSAGDYFDPPPTRDDSRIILKIVRNESTFSPTLAQTWKNTVNDADWTVANETFPANTVKVIDITGELSYNAKCGYYWPVTYEFEINPDTWTRKILDQGMRARNPGTGKLVAVLDEKGQSVSSPVLLDGAGSQLTTGNDPVFLEFELCPESDFSLLNFDFTNSPGY